MIVITIARKPLEGAVTSNALQYGTGALNIDACRLQTQDNLNGGAYAKDPTPRAMKGWSFKRGRAGEYEQPSGRWPTNIVLGRRAAEDLDEQSGISLSSGGGGMKSAVWKPSVSRLMKRDYGEMVGYGDAGGASRFFKQVQEEAKKE